MRGLSLSASPFSPLYVSLPLSTFPPPLVPEWLLCHHLQDACCGSASEVRGDTLVFLALHSVTFDEIHHQPNLIVYQK